MKISTLLCSILAYALSSFTAAAAAEDASKTVKYRVSIETSTASKAMHVFYVRIGNTAVASESQTHGIDETPLPTGYNVEITPKSIDAENNVVTALSVKAKSYKGSFETETQFTSRPGDSKTFEDPKKASDTKVTIQTVSIK